MEHLSKEGIIETNRAWNERKDARRKMRRKYVSKEADEV